MIFKMSFFKTEKEKQTILVEEQRLSMEALQKRVIVMERDEKDAFAELKIECDRVKYEFTKKKVLVPHIMFEYGAGRYCASHSCIGFSEVMKNFPEYRVVSVIECKNSSYSSDDPGGTYYKLFLELRPEMERFYEAI